tara:strand:- start:5087 stop:6292 length:1206 start_codon:yes stop_codon:yes gene_type:complete
MKLLYIHQYFTFPENSGGTRSYDLSKEFVKRGIKVVIITSSASLNNISFTKRWTYLEREGIKIWVLKSTYNHNMSIPRRIFSFLSFLFFSSFKVLKVKADLVLATSTPLTIAIPAIWNKLVKRTPYIFEVRDVWPEGPIQQGYVTNKLLIKVLRWFERFVYNQSAYVVALSTGMKRDILSRVVLKNIEVIPNISEIKRFKDLSKKVDINIDLSDKKVVLYAGTLGPVNDIMYVAKLALKLIKVESKIIFLIVGDGRQKDMILNFCKENNIINKNIYFLDPVNKEQLPYLYSKVIMGSSFVWDYKIKWDNSANKFFDTLAAGSPILINYQGWQAEVIRKNNCGYVLPYYFNDADVNAFAQYLMDDNKIIEQGKNAAIVAEDYSLDVAVDKYIGIFKKIKLYA